MTEHSSYLVYSTNTTIAREVRERVHSKNKIFGDIYDECLRQGLPDENGLYHYLEQFKYNKFGSFNYFKGFLYYTNNSKRRYLSTNINSTSNRISMDKKIESLVIFLAEVAQMDHESEKEFKNKQVKKTKERSSKITQSQLVTYGYQLGLQRGLNDRETRNLQLYLIRLSCLDLLGKVVVENGDIKSISGLDEPLNLSNRSPVKSSATTTTEDTSPREFIYGNATKLSNYFILATLNRQSNMIH